jgi:hypothetical protein
MHRSPGPAAFIVVGEAVVGESLHSAELDREPAEPGQLGVGERGLGGRQCDRLGLSTSGKAYRDRGVLVRGGDKPLEPLLRATA